MAPALDIARRYHDAWSTGDLTAAAALLADDLVVEVPINDYPTTASFVAALERFARATRSVDLLAAHGGDDDAFLLYDMDVEGSGALRVVEHFTVVDGRIGRLRQVHDTAALRAARAGA